MSEEELLKEHGFEPEIWEDQKNQFVKTGFPAPIKKYRIIWEQFNMSIEETYFWILNYLQDSGYPNIYKTEDVFAAAENSAFFGVSQQRIGLQQDKVSQFLATIGKMVKELFQLVRELRIIDERMVYYMESLGFDEDGNTLPGGPKESSEITLKGIWIDMVQGGAKNPSSVFGMAREVAFTSLPDLFFATHPRTAAEVDDVVDTQRSGFNKSVRIALKRHLKQFLVWKEKTKDELNTRKIFTLKYLRQHYEIIKMYMTWVRPYLRHIRRMTLDEERTASPDMVAAFEGSMVEIEFLATKLPVDEKSHNQNKHYHSCVLAHFLFRTRPSMSYQQEGYQRGPIHVGKIEMNLRAYVWSEEEIKSYIDMKDKQDMELMKSISDSVKTAMEALGGELEKYLEQAGEEFGKKKEEEKKPLSALQKLKAEFIGPKVPEKPKAKEKPKKKNLLKLKGEKSLAEKLVKFEIHYCFKNYKKAHNMIMW